MNPIPGTFRDEHTIELRSGHVVRDIHDYSDAGHPGFMTGWLAGVLYVSRDNGATWAPSDVGFRCG